MSKKILVVDNHPALLKFMAKLLSNKGYEVLTAVDGLSALSVLETCVPDVIFVDLILPNINGEKLCRQISARRGLHLAYGYKFCPAYFMPTT